MENNIVTPAPEVNVAPQKTNPPIVKILILVILLLVIVVIGLSLVPTPTPLPIKTPAPTIEATVAPVSSASAVPTIKPTITPTPKVNTNPNLKTFTSDNLKISFDYLQVQPDYPKEKVNTSVSGNKVYVYMGSNPQEGQWVEIFKKDKNDTLKQVISKQFLSGISENDCFVENVTSKQKYSPTYQVAEITFPYDPNSEIPFFAVEHKCPKGYTRSNGISFFLADANHPDIFLFFSIGQYGIKADNSQMWQGTIRFL